jgi:hypothetical protein
MTIVRYTLCSVLKIHSIINDTSPERLEVETLFNPETHAERFFTNKLKMAFSKNERKTIGPYDIQLVSSIMDIKNARAEPVLDFVEKDDKITQLNVLHKCMMIMDVPETNITSANIDTHMSHLGEMLGAMVNDCVEYVEESNDAPIMIDMGDETPNIYAYQVDGVYPIICTLDTVADRSMSTINNTISRNIENLMFLSYLYSLSTSFTSSSPPSLQISLHSEKHNIDNILSIFSKLKLSVDEDNILQQPLRETYNFLNNSDTYNHLQELVYEPVFEGRGKKIRRKNKSNKSNKRNKRNKSKRNKSKRNKSKRKSNIIKRIRNTIRKIKRRRNKNKTKNTKRKNKH